jgi:hypothetical protein
MKIFTLVEPSLEPVHCVTKFQQFIITLLRLRLDLMFTDLGYRFNISTQTVSRFFYKTLSVLYLYLRSFIIWPERDCIIATTPDCFKNNFQNIVTVIIDCFEIRTEKSSNLLAQSATCGLIISITIL